MWSVAAIVTLEPVTWARIRRPQVRLAGAVVRRKSVSTKGGERAFSIFAEPQGRRKCCSDNRPHPTASGHDADVGVKWKVQSRWRAVISADLTIFVLQFEQVIVVLFMSNVHRLFFWQVMGFLFWALDRYQSRRYGQSRETRLSPIPTNSTSDGEMTSDDYRGPREVGVIEAAKRRAPREDVEAKKLIKAGALLADAKTLLAHWPE